MRLPALVLGLALTFSAACGGGEAPGRPGEEAPDTASPAATAPGVEIEYIAHASFLIRSPGGTELLIDPFASRVWLSYDFPELPERVDPDAILITHPHYDHDAGRFRGAPFPWPEIPVLDGPAELRTPDLLAVGVEGKHADPYGEEFGQANTIMVVEAGGLRIAHLGDNGSLTSTVRQQVGRVDVLMIPGDDLYHILSPEETRATIEALRPRIVIPMHYRHPDLETDPDSPSDLGNLYVWLEGRREVRRVGSHRLTLRPDDLPEEGPVTLVLEHAPWVEAPEGEAPTGTR